MALEQGSNVTARLVADRQPDSDRVARSANVRAGQWKDHEAIRSASQAAVAFRRQVRANTGEIKGNNANPHTAS